MKRDLKFEEWLVLHVLAEVKGHAGRFLEVMPASESGLEVKYESELAQTAWAAWQARQAKIDELHLQLEQERELNKQYGLMVSEALRGRKHPKEPKNDGRMEAIRDIYAEHACLRAIYDLPDDKGE